MWSPWSSFVAPDLSLLPDRSRGRWSFMSFSFAAVQNTRFSSLPKVQVFRKPTRQRTSSVCVVPVSVVAPVRCAVHCADVWIPQTAWAILSHRQQTVSLKINNRWLPRFRLMCSCTRTAQCGKDGCVALANTHLTKPRNGGTKTDNDTTECLR